MGTGYPIHKNEHGGELSIDEHSGKLDIAYTISGPWGDAQHEIAPNLTPEQVVEVAVKMVQAALYNCGDAKRFFVRVVQVKLDELWK